MGLFDQVLGARQDRCWDHYADRFRGIEIDDHLKLGWSFDWKVAWSRAFNYSAHIFRRPQPEMPMIRAKRKQRAVTRVSKRRGRARQVLLARKLDDSAADKTIRAKGRVVHDQ